VRAADLAAELAEAQRRIMVEAQQPPEINGIPWGVGSIELAGRDLYTPRPDDGIRCLLFGVVERGELVDIAAVGPRSRTVRTRLGWAAVLGEDAIECARWAGSLVADALAAGRPDPTAGAITLRLVADPLAWVLRPRDCAFVIDWARVHFALADVPDVACSTTEVAARLRWFWPRPRMPRIAVSEGVVAAKPTIAEARHVEA
jgi:hypothetical protein